MYWYHGHGHREDIEVECEVKSALEAKPTKLIVGDIVVSDFIFVDGWWIANITSIGGGEVFFKVYSIEVNGRFVEDHFEYEV